MKKILLFIIIFLFSFSNIFAISEFEVSNADPNTKVYIPE
jgi:uncharacterized membrane protein